ncbi:MAG: hypothetical protein LQ343_004413 [Gyalolechia ehrenbergii]|nr:MAG: hypothetical protein LQ343_004413 [Gyalolechia ehrenbergii]
MPQTTPVGYQIRLNFLFAYDRGTLVRHAYGAQGLSPWESPKQDRLDYAALEHLALLLSGYDIAAEAWSSGVRSRDVRISTQDPDTRLTPYWSIRPGEGKAGLEMYGFQYGTETPFKSASDSHICCVQLVSPVCADTDEQWTEYANSVSRILKRLQTPGSLRPRDSPNHDSRINHLAWTNATCKFVVTVRTADDGNQISWPTLQNLQAAWGSSARELESLIQHAHAAPTRSAFRKLITHTDRHSGRERLESIYAISSLPAYLNVEAYIAAQYSVQKMSLMLDSNRQRCFGIRFEDHRATFDVAQVQFWTRLVFKAVVACGDMADKGRRFEEPGFGGLWNELIRDGWVREYARKLLR